MATRRGPDNTVRVAVSGVQDAMPWANVFWAQLLGAGAAAQADLDFWLANFLVHYRHLMDSQMSTIVTQNEAKATLFQPGGLVLHSVDVTTHVGAQVGTPINELSAAIVVSWGAQVYWRGGKPRTYLPGVITSEIQNGHQLTPTAVTNTQQNAELFRTNVNTLISGPITKTTIGFVSFRSGNADRPAPIFYPIIGTTVHGRLGSQRRRLGPWLP